MVLTCCANHNHAYIAYCSNHSKWPWRFASLQMSCPYGTPVILHVDRRQSRERAKVALKQQQREYRERAITQKGLDTLWDGLRMAVKHHIKHYGGDKHNKSDIHRATKVQLDRIERINASWQVKINKNLHHIDLIDLASPWRTHHHHPCMQMLTPNGFCHQQASTINKAFASNMRLPAIAFRSGVEPHLLWNGICHKPAPTGQHSPTRTYIYIYIYIYGIYIWYIYIYGYIHIYVYLYISYIYIYIYK